MFFQYELINGSWFRTMLQLFAELGARHQNAAKSLIFPSIHIQLLRKLDRTQGNASVEGTAGSEILLLQMFVIEW